MRFLASRIAGAGPSPFRLSRSRTVLAPARPTPAAVLPPDGPDVAVTVFGPNDILPNFMTALIALGCKPNILPADVAAPDMATTCIQNLVVPTPLEQSQILRAMENIATHVPIDPIESAVFRLLLAHDVATLEKLMASYQTYLGALSDLKETLDRVH